jgi:predicted exporter
LKAGVIDRTKPFALYVLWAGVLAVSVLIIVLRLNVTVDLAYFLPEPKSDAESVLVDRLGQGPGSQVIFISVPVADISESIEISEAIKAALESTNLFSSVINGQEQITVDSIPPEVWRNRYLIADVDTSVAGLRAAIQGRLADMALVSDDDFLQLIAADPYLTSVSVMQRLVWPGLMREEAWLSAERSELYLIAETVAPAFDTAAQRKAIDSIESAVIAVVSRSPLLNGVGVYGLELQETIRAEAQVRSLLATVVLMVILWLAYRNMRVVFLAGLPLIFGATIGLAAVAAVFGQVHGITLAFGFTLLGVAVDYPLHILSHARQAGATEKIRAIWPTMRAGAISTVVAYAALAFSGSRGLAQLGCFSAVGLLGAVYATRTFLPGLLEVAVLGEDRRNESPEYRPVFRHGLWIVTVALSAILLLMSGKGIWTNDLASLTPISPEKLQRDQVLRSRLGAPDIRTLLAVSGSDQEEALVKTEALEAVLNDAIEKGLLSHVQMVTAILPSRATQSVRRNRLSNEQGIAMRVGQAIEGTPLRSDAFDPFVTDIRNQIVSDRIVTAETFQGTALNAFIGSTLYFDGKKWMSLVLVQGLADPLALRAVLDRETAGVELIDLKEASKSLVERYRLRTISMLGLGFCMIGFFLFFQIGFGARYLWVMGTLFASFVMTIFLSALVLGQLSLFNLIAVVLVGGLGLDYALFFSRTEKGAVAFHDTRHAVTTCYLSTFFAFAILALSSVPILHSIGVTVAAGVCVNFALARLGVRYLTQ